MTHRQRVELIRPGVTGLVWADLGAGSGAFTLALLEVLGGAGQVFAVDKDARSLPKHPQVQPVEADFTQPLPLPPLDGLLMANSLHYIREKTALLIQLQAYLGPGGGMLIVEYEHRRPNPWVPYPVSPGELQGIAADAGLAMEMLGRQPSSFGGQMYAALLSRLK